MAIKMIWAVAEITEVIFKWKLEGSKERKHIHLQEKSVPGRNNIKSQDRRQEHIWWLQAMVKQAIWLVEQGAERGD